MVAKTPDYSRHLVIGFKIFSIIIYDKNHDHVKLIHFNNNLDHIINFDNKRY